MCRPISSPLRKVLPLMGIPISSYVSHHYAMGAIGDLYIILNRVGAVLVLCAAKTFLAYEMRHLGRYYLQLYIHVRVFFLHYFLKFAR